MARSRRSLAVAKENLAQPERQEAHKTTQKKRLVAPAKKMHNPRRSTRKPLAAVDANIQTKKSGSHAKGKQTKKGKKTSTTAVVDPYDFPVDALETGMTSPATIATQPLQHGTQRVAESVYGSSNVAAPTPSALEHSILVLKNFRRRPRQQSMLSKVKQRIASARSSTAADLPVFDSDDSIDLDDFLPDDAGTPMHGTGLEFPIAPLSVTRSSRSTKRKRLAETQAERSLDSFDRSLSKYRKLVSQSSDADVAGPEKDLAQQALDAMPRVESTPEVDGMFDTHLSITRLAAGTSPVSASSELSPAESLSRLEPDIYGPPTSQEISPPPRRTRNAVRKRAPSSALLQSLLPKRKKHFESVLPVPAPRLSDPESDDQYNLQSSPTSMNLDTSEYNDKATGSNVRRSRAEKRVGAAGLPQNKTSAVRNERNKGIAAKGARTYGRQRGVGNPDDVSQTHDDLAVPSTTMQQALKSNELEEARKKFEEVDKWEMDFETLTNQDSRSSSQNWR